MRMYGTSMVVYCCSGCWWCRVAHECLDDLVTLTNRDDASPVAKVTVFERKQGPRLVLPVAPHPGIRDTRDSPHRIGRLPHGDVEVVHGRPDAGVSNHRRNLGDVHSVTSVTPRRGAEW